MEAAEIKRNIKRMKLGTIDRYEGIHGVIDVRKTTGGTVFIIPKLYTGEALSNMVAAIKPESVCASPEDKNR